MVQRQPVFNKSVRDPINKADFKVTLQQNRDVSTAVLSVHADYRNRDYASIMREMADYIKRNAEHVEVVDNMEKIGNAPEGLEH